MTFSSKGLIIISSVKDDGNSGLFKLDEYLMEVDYIHRTTVENTCVSSKLRDGECEN